MDSGKVTENEIEETLAKTPNLIEEGLTLIGRQVSFGNLRVDLLFRDRFGENLIVEVKRGTIKREHIGQIMEYSGSLPDQRPMRLMLIGNRVPPAFRKSLDHHGIEWKEIRPEQIKPFLKPGVEKPVYPLDAGKLFEKFRQMSSFSPGEKIWFESTKQWHILRKQAKKKYAKIFDSRNIHIMTKEDFKSFLYFKNNLAWTSLYRRGLEAAERIDDLRKAIVFLQDESINIQERINSILRGSYHVRGMGKNIATAVLHTCDKQDRYGVWNNVTEKALKELGYLPRRVWNNGLFYSKLSLEQWSILLEIK
ncbi:MAG: endonuclease NucS [Thermoproteota archaeon]|nr:endonuclease NucS [Thermoproteota archaeon]